MKLLIPRTRTLQILVLMFFVQVFTLPINAFAEVRSIETVIAINDLKEEDSISGKLKNLNEQLTTLNQIIHSKINKQNLLEL